MKGHAFGNLFLSALEKMTGDFARGVKVASKVLDIVGVVEPITLTNMHLVMQNGNETVKGEFRIVETAFASQRPQMWLEPTPEPNPVALEAIRLADMVVVAPGNLYSSLAPALIVPGIGEALAQSKALKVYVCNLMTKPGQTDGFAVNDFADEIERLAGQKFIDVVLYNTEKPTDDLIKRYAKDNERPVDFTKSQLAKCHYKTVGHNLLSGTVWRGSKADPIASVRTLIRHDSEVVAKTLIEVYHRFRG